MDLFTYYSEDSCFLDRNLFLFDFCYEICFKIVK